jgi:AsmA protein
MAGAQEKRFGIFKLLGIAAVLLLGAILAIPFLVNANSFRPMLALELTRALGREVRVGNLKLSLFSGGMEADDIVIGDDAAFGTAPFVTAKSLQIGVELKPLIFSKVVHVTGMVLDKPEISLIRTPAGDWNFSSIGRNSAGDPSGPAGAKSGVSAGSTVAVNQLTISDARVTVLRGGGNLKPYVYEDVDISARNLSLSSVFPFSLAATLPGGGIVRIEGKAGPVNNTDAALTPFTATLAVERFDLNASGFVSPDSGLAGLIDFRGNVISDGKQMQSQGTAGIDKLRIQKDGSPAARTLSLIYKLSHDFKSQSGTIREAQADCGKASAHLSGSYDVRGDAVRLVMKLRGENMPAQDIEALLPAVGVTLPEGASIHGGALSADLVTHGDMDKLITTGTVGLFKARLAGFDLGAKMAAVASLAGIKQSEMTEIESLTAELRVAPEGISVSRLVLNVPALGELAGYGTVSSGHALNFTMLASLNTSESIVNRLTQFAGIKSSDVFRVPFTIGGTTAHPTFTPAVQGIAGKILGLDRPGKGDQAGAGNPGATLEDKIRELLGQKKK